MEKMNVYIATIAETGNKQLSSLIVPLLYKGGKSYLLLDQKPSCTHGCDVGLAE